MLKQEYKEGEMTLKDALKLAVKVLDKTLDITKLTPDKGQFLVISGHFVSLPSHTVTWLTFCTYLKCAVQRGPAMVQTRRPMTR